MDHSEKELIEKIKSAMNEEGAKILIEDIRKHLKASDTAKVIPILDNKSGNVLSSTTEELLKRQGYVMALDWVIGIMEHYQGFNFELFEEEDNDL